MSKASDGSALVRVMRGHGEQIGLCATLELIADALPDHVDPALCRAAAGSIQAVMSRAVETEREALTEELAEHGGKHVLDLTPTIERLLRENAEDLSYAEELQEALGELSQGHRTVSTDALGYMLRGFFEARRRRIALEREIFAALAEPAP